MPAGLAGERDDGFPVGNWPPVLGCANAFERLENIPQGALPKKGLFQENSWKNLF
jgi:hypothetical protein